MDEDRLRRLGNASRSEKKGGKIGYKLSPCGYARRFAVLSFSLIVVQELGSNALMVRVELGVRCDVASL
jgi:hypothetical protein